MKLYKGNCLEIMETLPSKSIDMVLCDLPYGVTKNKWDSVLPFDELWEQYNRIVKPNGAIVLFSAGLFTVDLINSNRKNFRYTLVWDKVLTSGFLNANRMPLRSHEDICVFYKKLPTYNPQFTEGEPLHSRGKLLNEQRNNNYGFFDVSKATIRTGETKKYPKSIIRFSRPPSSTMLHPTQKPVELLEYLIKTYSNENDTILDNCMGSGSTGVACKNTNRHFIGIELDEKYFNIAKERLFEHSF